MAPVRNTNSICLMRPAASTKKDPLAVLGHRLTCTVNMWWPGADLVTTGLEMVSTNDDELADMRASATGRKSHMMELVDQLSVWEPGFFERLNQAGTHAGAAVHDAKNQLNDGQSNGCSEDTRKVQEAMPKWLVWNPPLRDRLTRGMAHKECVIRLAPPNLDMNNENVLRKFMVDGKPAMTPKCWASFMWAEGQFDPQRPSNGLLEGELMLSAATAILFSPSSSMPETIQAVSGTRGHTRRRGPIGLAKKYKMKEVNPAFIAYVACMTRHALTTSKTFSEVCDRFSYTKLYYLICKVLESPKYEHWTKGLVTRWNEKLFAGHKFGLNTVGPADEANTILNMLDAELEGAEITHKEVGLELGGTTEATD
ncbi:hypothetical protein FRC08_017906 [Ceratobasidium sp. 394]|nr:hypothetical protein FRC08_017906 [Ceratobasidium sp. 394]